MPRRRPRVGQSVVDRTTWGSAIPAGGSPPNQFTLRFDNSLLDYTFDPGGGAPPVALTDLIVADSALLPPSINAWAGLAQPSVIQCSNSTGSATPLPPDFECRFTHPHRRWANVDELGEGDFQGMAKGMHQHVFRMDEWVLVEMEISPGVLESRWCGSHKH